MWISLEQNLANAHTFYKAGELDNSLAMYEEILRRWPNEGKALLGYAEAQFAAGKVEQSEETARRAFCIYGSQYVVDGSSGSLFWSIIALKLSGKEEEALIALDRGIKEHPESLGFQRLKERILEGKSWW